MTNRTGNELKIYTYIIYVYMYVYICIYILICSLFNELAISETDGGERKYIPFDYTYSQSVSQSVSQSTLRA